MGSPWQSFRRGRCWLLMALLVLSAASVASAERAESVAPFVVTPQRDVEKMLDLAGVGPDDYLIDLGAGDGRIVISAARRGARGHGVELEPALVERARKRARDAGVAKRTAFLQGDVFEAEVAGASVVAMYLFPDANVRLRPRLLEQLAPGTRVVSNSFGMGGWRPERHVSSASSGGIYLWIIPARAEGRWQLRAPQLADDDLQLELTQHFQQLEGTITGPDGESWQLSDAALRGERIRFQLEQGERRYHFSGRVSGTSMTGFLQAPGEGETEVTPWQAARNGSL